MFHQPHRGYVREPRIEIPRLLELARNQPRPCMLNVDGQCRLPGRRSEGQCYACHGNGSWFNKAGAMKAHDHFSVWGCAWCHDWLDESYSATGEERLECFKRALFYQIQHWSRLLAEPTIRPKDMEPIQQALGHLIDAGYAMRQTLGRRWVAIPIHPTDPSYANQQKAA